MMKKKKKQKDQQVNAYFSMEIPPNNMENSITESCSEQRYIPYGLKILF